MAKMVLYPEKTENDILRPRENDAVMLFVKSLDISKNYWASLEVPYYGLVRSLADSSEAEERKAKVDFWIRDVVSRNAKAAFNEGASKLPTDGRHLRSMTRALNNFNIKGVKYLRDEGVLV